MFRFKLTHRYCGMTTVATGYNVYDALKQGNFDMRYWQVDSIEEI